MSLTVNAYVGTVNTGDSTGNDTVTDRTPIEGVEFTAKEVCYNGAAIDLSTSAGWETIKGKDTLDKLQLSEAEGDTNGFAYCADGGHTGTTNAQGSATIAGATKKTLYVVSQTGKPESPTISKGVASFLVTLPLVNTGSDASTNPWIYDVVVSPKLETSTAPTKTVSNNSASVASANDTVTYTLSAYVPAPTAGRQITGYKFIDQLPSGLSDVTVASVTIGSTTATADTDYTVDAPSAANTNTLTVNFSKVATPGTKLEVVINAKIDGTVSATIENNFKFRVSDADTDATVQRIQITLLAILITQ